MSTTPSGATINPGIIEMQMLGVTAPRLGGGQVAHFIMLLSCCPLLVWEQGPLEGCCVAMYNSCSNSCMSGRERARETQSDREEERERQRERSVEGGLCCVLEAHCVYRRVCVCLSLLAHTHGRELGMQARVTGAHTQTHTHTKKCEVWYSESN